VRPEAVLDYKHCDSIGYTVSQFKLKVSEQQTVATSKKRSEVAEQAYQLSDQAYRSIQIVSKLHRDGGLLTSRLDDRKSGLEVDQQRQ
jgi:hypothetical protein